MNYSVNMADMDEKMWAQINKEESKLPRSRIFEAPLNYGHTTELQMTAADLVKLREDLETRRTKD